jgi:MFS family permease
MSATQIYYWFSALLGLGMGATATVYAPFLLSIGLSLGEIALVNAIFWTILIVAELPTGMFADGRSRAFSLKAGMIFQGLGAAVYFIAEGFWSVAVAEGLIGIGMAFMSGAQQAWISDALTREGKFEQIRRVFATENLIRTSVLILGGFIGTVLAFISYSLIWVPMIFTSVLAACVSHRHMNGQGEPMERITEREAFAYSWRHLLWSRALKWVIGSMILFGGVVSFNHFWSPYFETKVGTLGLSWVWTLIYLGYMPSSWMIRRMTFAIGRETHLIILSLLLSGAGLVIITIFSGLIAPLAAVMIHEFGRGMFQPLTDSFVQHRVHSSYRATFGSLQSFLGRIGFAIVPLIVWIMIEGEPNSPETIAIVWLACGSLLVVGSIVFWFARPQT